MKLAYERFYSDLLSFTFDSEKVPLMPGEQELRIDRENGKYTWSEITEGSKGLHWLDYMQKNKTASQAIASTVGTWTFAPAGSDDGGDYHCTYMNLKLSGQNATNNYAGTDYMRGLTFTITLERVEEPASDSSGASIETNPTGEPTHTDASITEFPSKPTQRRRAALPARANRRNPAIRCCRIQEKETLRSA